METDIKALLLRIKDNIRRIEDGDQSEPLLEEVRVDFVALLELIKLGLIKDRDNYYGYFMMNLQYEINFYENCIAGIKLNTFPPVFQTNPLLLGKFTLKEIIYTVCHEIDHIVLNHPAEMLKANPTGDEQLFYEFNLAADAAVNDRINYEIEQENHNFMSQPEGLITSDVLAEMFKIKKILPMENYAYYFDLIQNSDEKPKNPNAGGSSQGSNAGNSQKSETDENDNAGKSEVVTQESCGGKYKDHDWQAGNDAEDAQAAAKELVNAVFDTMNDETRGKVPGHFLSDVAKINKPPVLSWQAILKKYIGTITASKRKTRARLNRRQPERFDLSGTMDEKVLKIVVAIDTSASVSDQMIGQIFNEIFAILAKRKHDITVIECDAKVRRVYKAKKVGDIQTKVAGRGGTCFTPVIEYINDDKYFRDALLIYFTDGYGESEIPKPRTYRNMWVVLGGEGNLSLKEPYGAVLAL